MRVARLNPTSGSLEVFTPEGGHVERFLDDEGAVEVRLALAALADGKPDPNEGTFSILAYTGAPVSRWYGKLVIDVDGIKHERQTTQLLEHDDMRPVGVITKHEKNDKGLTLSGHFLADEASEDARRLRLQCRAQGPGRPGLRLKSSIGVRFMDARFLKEGEEVTCNGKTFKYSDKEDLLYVAKSHLFENSFIYCNPADLATSSQIMSHGAPTMKVNPATGQLVAASLPTAESGAPAPVAPSAGTAALSGPPIVRFADLQAAERDAVLAQAKAEIDRETLAFATAFPSDPAFQARMRKEGKTVEQAKIVAYDELTAKQTAETSAAKEREAVADLLGSQIGRSGAGFDATNAERRLAAPDASPVEMLARREAEQLLHKNPLAVRLFGHEALNVMTSAIHNDRRLIRLEGGAKGATMPAAHLRDAAQALIDASPAETRALLAGGHGPVDFGMITVKGFVDSFHSAMENEPVWATEIMYECESNQETEIVRWLGYHPQLQVFDAKALEAQVPVYSLQFTNVWYDHTLPIDVQDFALQKYGMINKLMGESGAVVKRHWNLLGAQMLEANPTGYDKVALFSTAHVLGGKSPATQTNDLSAANGNAFCALPDLANISGSQANNLLVQAMPFLNLFYAANGEPMNEDSSRKILVIVPEKWGSVFRAAVFSERLDGSPNGAGGSRDNALMVQAKKRKEEWDVVASPRLSQPGTANAANNYIYIALVSNDRKPLLRAEPIGYSTWFAGPGSETHRKSNKYVFWGRTMRSAAPGAFTSILRIKLGA